MERSVFLLSGLSTIAMKGSVAATVEQNDHGFAVLERHLRGRLGVYAIDTSNGREIRYRASERFPMCSTFKVLAVGAVLARVDAGNEDLARRVAIADTDLLSYAPIARQHLRIGSMTIAELCAAAIEWSDNTAANLLLHSLLGPAGVTKFARKIGDPYTRLDRNEPSLNTAIPGDLRDTTTPAAMAADLRALVTENVLEPASRARLRAWLIGCQTGQQKLRSHMPSTWRAGDKTGSGAFNTTNDIAIMWPPHRDPIVIAAYFTGSTAAPNIVANALADAGRLVIDRFSTEPPRDA